MRNANTRADQSATCIIIFRRTRVLVISRSSADKSTRTDQSARANQSACIKQCCIVVCRV